MKDVKVKITADVAGSDKVEQLRNSVDGIGHGAASVDKTSAALGALGSGAKTAADRIDNAFGVVGVRSAAQINGEIVRVNQALDALAREAKVTGAEFDRAWTAGQAQIAKLRAELAGTQPAVDQLGTGVKGLGGEFGGLTSRIVGAFAALQGGRAFIEANAQAETFARTMTVLTGSSEKAAAEMEYVRNAAGRLGIDVQEAAKSYTQLVAATKDTALEGEGARQVFEAVAGAMASLGKSSADTNNALLAVNQMASKGTVSMEELKGQLGEALPGAMKAAANGAGLTVAELTKMVESGGVLAEDLLPALAEGLKKMYGVGKTENDTFTAQWARLKNSVNETMVVLGNTGVFAGLTEGLAAAAKAVGVLSTGFVAAGQKIGIMSAAIANGDLGLKGWSERTKQALGEVDARTAESLEKLSKVATKTGAAVAEAGNAAEKGGKQAEGASSGWLTVDNAYKKVEESSTKQISTLKTLQEARDAEGASLKAAADTYGTQAEKLAAATKAAEMHEAAVRALAEQVRADLEIAKARLASIDQERDAEGNLTKDKEKLREELVKTIEAKQAEADKTAQATEASHAASNQAQAAAAVYADHAKQVYALRDAWQAAEVEYQRLAAASAKGANVASEMKAADEARAKALLLYRDALADATAAAERHVESQRRASSIQQSAAQNDLYRANTILEIAKQRGNEKDVAEAQIAVWRIELEITEAQAKAARLEAEGMLLVAKAKREELLASGALTEQKKAELALMEANIKAKQLEAEKYDLVAERMRKLNYETNELAAGYGDLSDSAGKAASSADRAAQSYDGLATSIRDATKAKSEFATNTRGEVVTSGPDVSGLAAKYANSPEQQKLISELFPFFYQKALQDPQNRSTTQGVAYGAAEQQAIAQAVAEAQRRASGSSGASGTSASTAGGTGGAVGYGNIVRHEYVVRVPTKIGSVGINVSDKASAEALSRFLQEELAAES